MNKMGARKKRTAEGREHPIGALLRGLGGGGGGREDGGAGGRSDEQLSLCMGFVRVIGEVSTFAKKTTTMARKRRGIGNPKWKMNARLAFGFLG